MGRPSWLKTQDGTFVNPDNVVEIRIDFIDDENKKLGVIANTIASQDYDENLLAIYQLVLYRGTDEACEAYMAWFERNYEIVEYREPSDLKAEAPDPKPVIDAEVVELNSYTDGQLSQFRDMLNDGISYPEAADAVGMHYSTAYIYSRAWPKPRALTEKGEKGAHYSEPIQTDFFNLLDLGFSTKNAADKVGMDHDTANAYVLSWKLKNGHIGGPLTEK